jgi:hypothetical protein
MRTKILLAASAASLLTIGLALPAAAATGGSTGATITITGGVLAMTVPTATIDFGSNPDTVAGTHVTAALGTVQVNDARSAAAGASWVETVISTAFTPSAGPTIPASAVSIVAGTITKVGTATYVANDPTNLTAVSPAVTASAITGDNSATWAPTLGLAIPGSTAAGTYTATVTQSVS